MHTPPPSDRPSGRARAATEVPSGAATPRRRRRWPKATWLVVRVVVVVAGSSLAGAVVLVGAARASASPTVFVPAGLLAIITATALGARWLTGGARRRRGPERAAPRSGVLAAAVAAVAVLAVVLGALVPTGAGRAATAVPGEGYWRLPTGSRLRYVRVPAQGQPRPDPVVFLHGGPGTPDLAGDAPYFGRLAADGFDVYLYDELGSGRSTRLHRPGDYALARDVADLEAVRATIGADRLILIGHSYGANLAAGYLAAHPDRVARVVFSSPGSLDPADASGGNLTSRLDRGRLLRLYARVLRPRNLLVYALLQVDADAAHDLAGDAEMDARNDQVYALSEPALHCAGHAVAHPPTGTGFYRLQYPQSAPAPPDPDLRPELSGNPTPALVVKGACDYQSWSSAVTYLDAFPDARLVYLRGGGHNSYQDLPAAYLASLRAFLTANPLPVAPFQGTAVPADYQGPR